MRTVTGLTLVLVAGTAACALVAARADAQMVVDPGMGKVAVLAKLGKPSAERTKDAFTYLFYTNGSERRVGMNDVVVLENDKVIDAVFRSGTRRYSGTSSSPTAIPAEDARKQGAMAPRATLQVTPPDPKAPPTKKP